MKVGDRIRVDIGWSGMYEDLQDFTVEEFRYCLGIFISEGHRTTDTFTPLCELYGRGPDSTDEYLPNFGAYITNKVPSFMNLPKP